MINNRDIVLKNLEQIHNVCLKELNGDLYQQSGTLYHYCNIDSCLSILTSGTIRLTDIRYLNDPNEIIGGLNLLWDVINEIFDDYKKKHSFYASILMLISYHLEIATSFPQESKSVIEKAKEDFKSKLDSDMDLTMFDKRSRIYISCFSEDKDDLRQWIPYANNGKGVSLGFQGIENNQHSLASSCTAIKVSYASDYDKKEYLRNIFKKSYELFINIDHAADPSLSAAFAANLFVGLIGDAIACKSENYKDEKEWRLAFIDRDGTVKKDVSYNVKNDIIRPYIEIPIEKQSLKEIVLGPKAERVLNKASLIGIVTQHQYPEAKLHESNIQYR